MTKIYKTINKYLKDENNKQNPHYKQIIKILSKLNKFPEILKNIPFYLKNKNILMIDIL